MGAISITNLCQHTIPCALKTWPIRRSTRIVKEPNFGMLGFIHDDFVHPWTPNQRSKTIQPSIIHCGFRTASTDHNVVGSRPITVVYHCVFLSFLDPLHAERRVEEVRPGFLSSEVVDGATSRSIRRVYLLQKVNEGTLTPAPSLREADMSFPRLRSCRERHPL